MRSVTRNRLKSYVFLQVQRRVRGRVFESPLRLREERVFLTRVCVVDKSQDFKCHVYESGKSPDRFLTLTFTLSACFSCYFRGSLELFYRLQRHLRLLENMFNCY